jgi:hypothetical protein
MDAIRNAIVDFLGLPEKAIPLFIAGAKSDRSHSRAPFRKTAMTEPSSDNSKPDFFHNPQREFVFKLLDAGITHACGSEVFVDNLPECGLLEEY